MLSPSITKKKYRIGKNSIMTNCDTNKTYSDWNLENLLYLVYSKCLTAFARVLIHIHIQIGWTHDMKNIHSKVILIQWPCSTTHTKCLNVWCMLLFFLVLTTRATFFGVVCITDQDATIWNDPWDCPQLSDPKMKTYSSHEWAKEKHSMEKLSPPVINDLR